MNTIPIPCNDDTLKDPFYRYKRSELKIDKCSNYLKLDNLDQIAKQLKVDQQIIINNIRKYLNCSIKIINEKVCISGKSENDIDNMLEKFIVENIICPKCNYPELELNYNTCNSCGHSINKYEENHDEKKLKIKISKKESKQMAREEKQKQILNARKAKKEEESSDSE